MRHIKPRHLALTVALCLSAQAHADATSGLVGYWAFENNAEDSSANGNHGTATSVTYEAGQYGNAARFNGSSSNINVANHSSLDFGSGDFTVSTWIYPESGTGVQMRIANDRGTGAVDAVRGWQFVISDATGENGWFIRSSLVGDASDPSIPVCRDAAPELCSPTYPYNDWYHVSMVYSSANDTVSFYVNGTLSGTLSNVSLGTIDNALPLGIGAALAANGQVATPSQFFKGMIDELRIYNRALTATDLQEVMSIGVPPCETIPQTITSDTTLAVPADYADVVEAMECLGTKRIMSNATTTIQVAPGTYNNHGTIVVDHLDGAKIKIIGDTQYPESVVLNFHSTAVDATYGQTLGLLDGMTLNGTIYGNGVEAKHGSYVRLGDHVTLNGFSNGIECGWGAEVWANRVTISNSHYNGIYGLYNCTATAMYAEINNSTKNGVYVTGNSTMIIEGAQVSYNTLRGVNADSNSYINAKNVTAEYNGNNGFTSENMSLIYALGSSVSNNGGLDYSPGLDIIGNNNSLIDSQ